MIIFSDVTKMFKGRIALQNVNFAINPGEFVCVTGPSGAGKSTIVHLLICAEVPTKGIIEVDGQNLAKIPHAVLQLYRRRTGVVFQDYKLLSDRTVYDNIAFAMEVSGDPTSII
jgi:cell division transport system ATP-binding protein